MVGDNLFGCSAGFELSWIAPGNEILESKAKASLPQLSDEEPRQAITPVLGS